MGRRYRLLAKLEEGAFAEHYKATAEGPGASEVLIKLFTPKASDTAYARALLEVSQRTRGLGLPTAIGFDELGMVQGRIAAVRPFVNGYNLGDALRRLSTKEVVLPPALALYVVSEAAQVVSAAHKAGWVHGAITPGNVLLGADGRVRVVDFGALEAMNASEPLRALAAKGRNAYRAPEVKGSALGAPASDVYSLGAIAYELLTLQSVAGSRGGKLSTKRDSLTPPSRLDRRINARVDPPIMRALEPAATRRFHHAGEYAEALRGLFSVLGYAPGAAEAAKFVKELFPNEVSVGASVGPLPFSESFVLAPVDGGATSSVDLHAIVEDRASFTSGEFAVPAEPSAPTEPPKPAALPTSTEPTLPVPSPVEDWDAPPGVMPASVNRLARKPRARPAETAVANLPDDEASVTGPAPPDTLQGPDAPAPVELVSGQHAVPDGGFDEPKDKPRTTLDWHVPPEPDRPPPPHVRVSKGLWVLAIVVCGSIAAFIFFAVGSRLGRVSGDIAVVGVRDEPEAPPPPTPLAAPKPDPAPRPVPEAPRPALLTIESDREAMVLVDGKEIGKSTPVSKLSLPPGTHTVSAVAGSVLREKQVTLKAGEEERVFLGFSEPPKKPRTGKTVKKGTK